MPQKNFVICFVFALWVITGCSSKKTESSVARKKQTMTVEAYVVKAKIAQQTILVSGSLKSFEETSLNPEISGRVVQINLPEGKRVAAGTLLVKLFDEDLQAQLKKLQAQLLLTEQTLKRQTELLKVNGISQLEYEQTTLQVNSIKADIDVVKVQIRKTQILAPYDGTIGLRNISLGASVSPATALAVIRDDSKLKLDFNVPEKYSTYVKVGMKVNFTLQGNDKKIEAEVMATEQGIETSSRNLKVRAIVENTGVKLVAGSFASVELVLGENKEALMIPTNAIIPADRNKSVIVKKNGKAKFAIVKTGLRNDTEIEIVSGVEVGDTLLTTGILFVKPGDKVKISKCL